MSYCQVSDVITTFPYFVEGQPGSVQDATIQNWIDDGAGVVHASFVSRGLDVNNLSNPLISDPSLTTPTYDQVNILRGINVAYAIWKLAEVLWNTLTPAQQAFARGQYTYWETSLKRINSGFYDKEFFQGSATVMIQPFLTGTGGAEAPPEKFPYPHGGRRFSVDQVF